jgi:hypothetical protein
LHNSTAGRSADPHLFLIILALLIHCLALGCSLHAGVPQRHSRFARSLTGYDSCLPRAFGCGHPNLLSDARRVNLVEHRVGRHLGEGLRAGTPRKQMLLSCQPTVPHPSRNKAASNAPGEELKSGRRGAVSGGNACVFFPTHL